MLATAFRRLSRFLSYGQLTCDRECRDWSPYWIQNLVGWRCFFSFAESLSLYDAPTYRVMSYLDTTFSPMGPNHTRWSQMFAFNCAACVSLLVSGCFRHRKVPQGTVMGSQKFGPLVPGHGTAYTKTRPKSNHQRDTT